jgi:S-adenosylmethionine decarboxylase
MIEYKAVEARIYNYRAWISGCDVDDMVRIINESLAYAGYNVLKFVDYQFPVKGYTSMWLLAESHMALHYFADEGKYYIELSGCCENMNKKFNEIIVKYNLNIEKITE